LEALLEGKCAAWLEFAETNNNKHRQSKVICQEPAVATVELAQRTREGRTDEKWKKKNTWGMQGTMRKAKVTA
jgi:hypothetical protein